MKLSFLCTLKKIIIIVFTPPRNGPTIWEIGIPDRTAAEFHVPDGNPRLENPLFMNHPENCCIYHFCTSLFVLSKALSTIHLKKSVTFEVVMVNDPSASSPQFSTGLIGKDKAIARHGIHGLYQLFSICLPGHRLISGSNTIYLRQSSGEYIFNGVMYDYLRLEGPPVQTN
ncbi:unnamed protein product [Coffea canephora]|uniref:Rhamnogalacturonan lyase domain-containing protein n=1 Tax=Coffea canephora TaxID=49390 RepID=A0A068U0A8_COFCA|nr:unnamed protein product [Coffea canephora]